MSFVHFACVHFIKVALVVLLEAVKFVTLHHKPQQIRQQILPVVIPRLVSQVRSRNEGWKDFDKLYAFLDILKVVWLISGFICKIFNLCILQTFKKFSQPENCEVVYASGLKKNND